MIGKWLGHSALVNSPRVNGTLPQMHFGIELSLCAATARPRISFTDKSRVSSNLEYLGLSPSFRTAKGVSAQAYDCWVAEPVRSRRRAVL